jgi:hypothetical protein
MECCMTNAEIAIIVVVIIIAVATVAWYFLQYQRTRRLRAQFGPEYERTVSLSGNRRRAENDLLELQRRMEKIRIRPLSPEESDRFAAHWRTIQNRFVDDPAGSTREADLLVSELMQTRGYPMADFEHRVADLSVEHPTVVRNYRAAHVIALGLDEGKANTENLRQAVVHYRNLFDDLLEVHPVGPRGVNR